MWPRGVPEGLDSQILRQRHSMVVGRQPHAPAAFTPRKCSWYSFSLGSGTVEGNMSLKNPVTTPGIDPGTVRLVAQRLNHYATPGLLLIRQ